MSNIFSDMLLPISDFIEGIPVIGKVIELADKLADNTDPSQLGTAGIGKLIASTGKDGEWFEDTFTSEDARKGASHGVGLAALAYILGGAGAAGAGSEAGAAPVTGSVAAETGAEGAGYGAGMTVSGNTTGLYVGAGAEAAAGGATESAALMGGAANAAAYAPSTVSGVTTGSYEAYGAALAAAKNKSIADAGLKIARAGVNLASPKQEAAPTGGSSSSREPQSQIQNQQLNAMMKEALGTDQSSAMFNTASVTPIKETEKNVLYKSFLSGDNKSSLTSTKVGGDLAFRTKKSKLSDKKSKSYDDEYTYSGLKNISIASPFY